MAASAAARAFVVAVAVIASLFAVALLPPSANAFSEHHPVLRSLLRQHGLGGVGPTPCPQHPKPLPLPSPLPLSIQAAITASESLIKLLMNKTTTTAMSLAILYNGEKIWTNSFNLHPPGKQNPAINLDTPFRIGSLSKVFTDIFLMTMRDQGVVALDDPVKKYWPNFNPPSPWPNKVGITFRELATQLSGFPTGSPCNYIADGCNITTDQAFANLDSRYAPIFPTDYFPHYSDGAFAILGRSLEKPAGITWEDFIEKYVFTSLQLNNTGWVYTPEVIARMAVPLMGSDVVPPEVAFDDMGWARPTGGMYSSVNDISALVQMLLDGHNSIDGLNGMLSSSSIREMLLSSFINEDQNTGFGFPFEWAFSPTGKVWLTLKGGFFPGYTAGMLMVPKLNFGVVALCNNILGATTAIEIADIVLPALQSTLFKLTPPPPNPGNLTAFVGNYTTDYSPLPSIKVNVSITLSPNGQNLLVGPDPPTSAPLVPLNWLTGNAFNRQPTPNTQCFSEEISSTFEYVVFQAAEDDPSRVVSFYEPGTEPFWGVQFIKQ